VLVDGTPIKQHPYFKNWDQPEDDAVIGPGATLEFGVSTHDNMPTGFQVQLRWTDDSGERTWASTLRLVW
jgi:hypothetical protein